jgi:hypothetical protein
MYLTRVRVGAVAGVVTLGLGCADPTGSSPAPVAFEVAPVAGNHQTGPTGAPLAEGLVVKATDIEGRGLEAVTIFWSVESGDGRFAHGGRTDTSLTDAEGTARVRFTPMSPGLITVLAAADRSPAAPVRFTVEALPPDWLPTFETSTVIYDRGVSDGSATRDRYVLQSSEAGSLFSFQYLSCCFSGEFRGTYAIEGNRITFAFDANPGWMSTGTLSGDSMYVAYNFEALFDGFQDGRYIRSR